MKLGGICKDQNSLSISLESDGKKVDATSAFWTGMQGSQPSADGLCNAMQEDGTACPWRGHR